MKHSISRHSLSSDLFKTADKTIDDHREKIESYVDRLLWWNERINLISRNVSRETLIEHVRHSLALTAFDIYQKADHVIDTGTGGGLPGIPMAIASPYKAFSLNDIVTKKIRAVDQMKRRLQLKNIQTDDQSIESLTYEEDFLLISKHAFKINQLYQFTKELPWSAMVFYKSADCENELKGIDTSLNVSIYDLSAATKNDFYEGKGIVIIERK